MAQLEASGAPRFRCSQCREDFPTSASEHGAFQNGVMETCAGTMLPLCTFLCREGREEFTIQSPTRSEAEADAAIYNGVVIREVQS